MPLIWPVVLLLLVVGFLITQLPRAVSHAQAQFADPAFRTLWERSDGPVASTAVQRAWVWGPQPGRTLSEPFTGIPGNAHNVQYFDKGRMEINNPNGDKSDPFYVTNGLLAVELISGMQQNGVSAYQGRGPASINLASDADDPSAPTYQSFNGVSNIPAAPNERRAQSSVGSIVRTAIDRQGITQPWPQDHPDYGVRIAHFEPTTGHNIPDVFWDYLNSQGSIIQDGKAVQGPLFFPWFSVTGYPISEPYWSYVKVEGRYTDVLIQAFERRVLTFVPHFQVGYKVQMGNIGMHYYDWRYLNAGPPQTTPGPATPTAAALPPRATIRIDGIEYRKSLTDLNGNMIIITNAGQAAVSFNGWWLDSPKWGYVDRFYFPDGVTLAPGATLRIHAGTGRSTATDLYMFRTTVMWEGQPFDLAVLYDNFGREVVRYFPAAETGPPPTQVAATPPRTGTPGTPGVTATAQRTGTPVPGATNTPTKEAPTAVPTGSTPINTATGTRATGTATGTPGQGGLPSPTRTATRTPTP